MFDVLCKTAFFFIFLNINNNNLIIKLFFMRKLYKLNIINAKT